MSRMRVIFWLLGLALLGLVLARTDLAEVGRQVAGLGWGGVAIILSVFFVAFVADTLSWQVVLRPARLSLRGLYRVWKIRMIGQALNNVIPALGVGGEFAKALLLKRDMGIGYRKGAASLIITETINFFAMGIFAAAGLWAALEAGVLPEELRGAAIGGLIVCSLAAVGFFLFQVLRGPSFIADHVGRTRVGRRIRKAVAPIRDLEDHLVGFYSREHARFAWAFVWALMNSVLGAVETYLVLLFLGYPVTALEAWTIAAVVELVRFGTFFIPGSIGAQEGALVILVGAMTGKPELGLAVALVRRFRELVWIVWGLLIAWRRSLGGGDGPQLVMPDGSERQAA